ncbi:MAG TPA: hypothetical protein VFO34_13125 [Candidatus Acidoferrales bacterium]|nr:hypothetical protein [Candidatus Acidoferrales bacterium]
MRQVFEVLNRMKADGVISAYAIGGAVGATFYTEPAATYDVDVFVSLAQPPGKVLVSLAPIYEYLGLAKYATEGQYIIIEGWPVQFLTPSDALEQEAIEEAVETSADGASTRIMSAEHLAAIALRTGRSKDYLRILAFLEQGALDSRMLQGILQRHGLTKKWQEFSKKYLGAEDVQS